MMTGLMVRLLVGGQDCVPATMRMTKCDMMNMCMSMCVCAVVGLLWPADLL